jgi:hypothetical protein
LADDADERRNRLRLDSIFKVQRFKLQCLKRGRSDVVVT